MNSITTQIVPKDITTTKTISSFYVNVQSVELFKNVTLNVRTFDNNNNIIDVKYITLEGQDYLNWNNNDQYIIDKVAEILGFTLTTTE